MQGTHGTSQYFLQFCDNTFRQVAHLTRQACEAFGFRS